MSQSFFDQFRSDTVMYNEFIAILDQHGLKLSDIQNVIGTLKPLDAA